MQKIEIGGNDVERPGWTNYDINYGLKRDVTETCLDEIPDNSVELYYTHHCIEHLPLRSIPKIFANMYRSLQTGGYVRIGFPDADMIIDAHIKGNFLQPVSEVNGKFKLSSLRPEYDSLEEIREKHLGVIGGWNASDLGNAKGPYYGHRFFWTKSFAYYVLWMSGFRDIYYSLCNESKVQELIGFDNRFIKYTSFVEAKK